MPVAGSARSRATVLAMLWLVFSSSGCESMRQGWNEVRGASGEPVQVETVETVVFDEWHPGRLHCAEGECSGRFAVEVPSSGLLRVDIYASRGPGVPDYDLELLDEGGLVIATPAEPDGSPRRMETQLEPGRYLVELSALRVTDGVLAYDLTSRFTPGDAGSFPPRTERPPSTRPSTRPSTQPPTRPSPPGPSPREPEPEPAADEGLERTLEPPPEPIAASDDVLRAEILDIELEQDAPTHVLLDAGRANGVGVGTRGRLRDQGAIVGEIEIVEVYPDGSRARIVGVPLGDITIFTTIEIVLPRR